MEQPAAVVLVATDDPSQIARRFSNVAEDPDVGSPAFQVPGPAGAAEAAIVSFAAACGVHSHAAKIERNVPDRGV